MSITSNGISHPNNGNSISNGSGNGTSNGDGVMQYYQGATGGAPYGYFYEVPQAYQSGDIAAPDSPNEGGQSFPPSNSQDVRQQPGFSSSSAMYMQRVPNFQQSGEYPSFGGDKQGVFGSSQNFSFAQGGVYADPSQFITSPTLGPQSTPMVSASNVDVIGRPGMIGGQTLPMLGAGIYGRGAMPMVNDQNLSQMRASWADVTRTPDSQGSISGTLPQMSPIMQPRILSPGHQYGLAPTTSPQLFALGGSQLRYMPANLPTYGRAYPPYQLLALSGQGRGGRGMKQAGGRGKGNMAFFPGRGFFEPVLNQRYESGNERGPRAQRIRYGQPGGTDEELSLPGGREQFNRADFDVAPAKAKFFVIKSYSEDDVHKSIKYGVWASTPNGNKRLQAAFREAQEEGPPSKVFLLFSVNASGQFCGVAEMTGDVDFDKSLEVWQQDKWNGQFTVQWHFVKDVPNNQFRHIILANNESKPVTNSRDTQEVPYDQGLEVLSIFQSFSAKTSILDDFGFYDNRQKQLQERREKSKQNRNQRRHRAETKDEGGASGEGSEMGAHEGTESEERKTSAVKQEPIEEQLADLTVTDRSQEAE